MCEHNSISTVYIYHRNEDSYTKIRKCLICNEVLEQTKLTSDEYQKEIGI
jgi:NADH:ubiquinone oxidoreductase subunit